jgi:hypothetical protein
MIQRKQTLFLLAALILTIVCLCLPVGSVEPKGMGISPVIYNLGIKGTDSAFTFGNCPMFILLLITCPIAIAAIFLYHKRKLQAKLCVWNIVLNVVWYAYFGFCWYSQLADMGTFHPTMMLAFPLISVILYVMARKGIIHDEKLVRAADRIR